VRSLCTFLSLSLILSLSLSLSLLHTTYDSQNKPEWLSKRGGDSRERKRKRGAASLYVQRVRRAGRVGGWGRWEGGCRASCHVQRVKEERRQGGLKKRQLMMAKEEKERGKLVCV